MAAVRVPTANRPPPNPINVAPARNKAAEPSGSAKITAANATNPANRPMAATRCASAPRCSQRAASANAVKPPSALIAVIMVVALTDNFRISPP